MIFLRRLFAVFLVMSMVVTSGAMATMRGGEDGAQRLVICTGAGTQVIMLGPDGEQIERAPVCPDCTIAFYAPPMVPFALALPLATSMDVLILRESRGAVSPAGLAAQPRAPPAVQA